MDADANNEGKSRFTILFAKVSHAAQRQYERAEAHVLTQLRARMDRLERPKALTYLSDTSAPPTSARGQAHFESSLPSRMVALMERADTQDRIAALDDLFHHVLDQLVPDEIRILGALSDGASFALIHAGYAPRIGPMTRRLIENFCPIGKPAGVKLLEYVPAYISHLRELGLVETGPEDPAQDIKYQILESDVAIREALEAEQKGVGMTAKYLRRTLSMSEFGHQFWDTCTGQNPTS